MVLLPPLINYRYNEKKETETSTDKIIKKNYVEARGHNWSVSNKRPAKLRDSLKYFEVSNLIYAFVGVLCFMFILRKMS